MPLYLLYLHIVAFDSQRHSNVFPRKKKNTDPWEVSLFFVISLITGPLMSRTISSLRGVTYITDDFDNSFRSGTVYTCGPTITNESGYIPLSFLLSLHLIN